MIIIHVSVHLDLFSIVIISNVQYDPIILIIDIRIVIFCSGMEIILGSNTINEKLIRPPCYLRGTTYHRRVMIVASLLWLNFVDKIRGEYSRSPMLI